MLGIIINTKSGKKAYLIQRYYLFDLLKSRGEEYVYRITKYANHAGELARQMAEEMGIRRFLVLGGDGTISETINGLMRARISDPENLEFGFMPRGTGNDYGRFWKLTKNYRESLDRFFNGKPQPIDVGCVTYLRNGEEQKYYFLNSIGFGVDARTCQYTSVMKYYVGSHSINYFFSLLMALGHHKSRRVVVTTKEGETLDFPMFAMNIGNGPYVGGGLQLNPAADPRDGIFHSMFINKPSFGQVLSAIPRIFNGHLTDLDFIHTFVSSDLTIDSPVVDEDSGQHLNHFSFEADGIIVDTTGPLHVECLHHVLKLVC